MIGPGGRFYATCTLAWSPRGIGAKRTQDYPMTRTDRLHTTPTTVLFILVSVSRGWGRGVLWAGDTLTHLTHTLSAANLLVYAEKSEGNRSSKIITIPFTSFWHSFCWNRIIAGSVVIKGFMCGINLDNSVWISVPRGGNACAVLRSHICTVTLMLQIPFLNLLPVNWQDLFL